MIENLEKSEESQKLQEELRQIQEEYGLLEIKDVLPILNVCENTFRDWVKKGDVLPEGLILKFGNTIRIRKNFLLNYLRGEI